MRAPADSRYIDSTIAEQIAEIERVLRSSPTVWSVVVTGSELGIPGFYVGAGSVAQTVWNHVAGLPPLHGLKDIDLVYFDSSEDPEGEARTVERVAGHFEDLPLNIDVKNQARVHTWYGKKFGKSIPPYRSTEHAISTWPTTASSIGVRLEQDRFVVCAPYGLRDLLSQTVRPNKTLVEREMYEEKAARWIESWPNLKVVPWS
jgi:hypothetical protein